uniref:Transposase n=1 Tax=blood disease bacterium R229 TaxID=741978 RepID=G2ZPG0_9RALS|nr:hypothetical protein BDB_110392 [blood disease bacterium R229]
MKPGVEELLAETIDAAKRAGVIKAASVKRVIVDTTVMEKAIAHPTDSRLLERCREHAREGGSPPWAEVAAELQPRGATAGHSDRSLRTRQAVQAHEARAAHLALARRPRDARR